MDSSNALAGIQEDEAKEIRELHLRVMETWATTLPDAIRIGALLVKVKARLPHGWYQGWIEKNLPFSLRTASDYVNFYKNREQLKSANVADLNAARRLLAPAPAKPDDDHGDRQDAPADAGDDEGGDAVEELSPVREISRVTIHKSQPAKEVPRVRGIGLDYAHKAVAELQKIMPDDPQYNEALDVVGDWCEKELVEDNKRLAEYDERLKQIAVKNRELETRLQEAIDIDVLKAIAAEALAVQQEAAEIKIRIERRLGQLLKGAGK